MTTLRKPVSLKLTADELDGIDAAAAVAGLSRSAWLKRAIGAALTTNVTTGVTTDPLAELARRVDALEKWQAQTAISKTTDVTTNPTTNPTTSGTTDLTTVVTTKATTPRRRLDTDPAAMAIIMERYAQGIAPAAVADELNAAGYKTGGGKEWDKASVSETGYRARRAAAKNGKG